MACRHMSNVENGYTADMIFKCSLQTLHMQMKFKCVMIVQIIQEQSLNYNPL